MKGISKTKATKLAYITYYTVLNRPPSKAELDYEVNRLVKDDEYDDIDITYGLMRKVYEAVKKFK